MAKYFSNCITDRTIADVNRVKELLVKYNLTTAEYNEFHGYMKGRFTYEDMNRICEYVNYIRTWVRQTIYIIEGSYPPASDVPGILPTNYTIDSVPTSQELLDILQIVNYTLAYIGEPTITFKVYDYNYFNALEKAIEKLDTCVLKYDTESSTTPANGGYHIKTSGAYSIPLVFPTDFNGYMSGTCYKQIIMNKITPMASNSDNNKYYFRDTQIIDVSNCFIVRNNTDALNRVWGETNFFASSIVNSTTKQVILPSNTDLHITNGFLNWQALESLNVERVVDIGAGSFENCSSINNLNFASLTAIPAGAFVNCSALSNLTLSNTLTQIASNAFQNCSALTSITFNGTMAEWGNITLNTGWHDANTPITKIICKDGNITL